MATAEKWRLIALGALLASGCDTAAGVERAALSGEACEQARGEVFRLLRRPGLIAETRPPLPLLPLGRFGVDPAVHPTVTITQDAVSGDVAQPIRGEVNLAVEQRVSIERVRDVLESLPAGAVVHVLVQDADAPLGSPFPRPPEPLAVELERVRALPGRQARERELARILARTTGGCEGADAYVPLLDPDEPFTSARADPRAGALLDALDRCRCQGLDTQGLLALLAWRPSNNPRPLHVLDLERAPSTDPSAAALPTTGTIEDLVTLLETREPRSRRLRW